MQRGYSLPIVGQFCPGLEQLWGVSWTNILCYLQKLLGFFVSYFVIAIIWFCIIVFIIFFLVINNILIFTTAFSAHALAAFNTNAVDYLLKPIRRDRLEEALKKARKVNRAQLLELGKNEETDHARSHISAQISGNIHLVPIEEIYFFHAEQKYVTVRHHNGEVITDESLKSLEEEFGDRFIRIHRNALVSTSHLDSLEKQASGQWMVKLRGIDEKLEVSRRHMTQVRKQLKQLRK